MKLFDEDVPITCNLCAGLIVPRPVLPVTNKLPPTFSVSYAYNHLARTLAVNDFVPSTPEGMSTTTKSVFEVFAFNCVKTGNCAIVLVLIICPI